jgi:uncharacterized protein YoxC
MMTTGLWALEAASEIISIVEKTGKLVESQMIEVMQKHCPFKPNTLYEEVGETSRKLDEILAQIKTIKRQI